MKSAFGEDYYDRARVNWAARGARPLRRRSGRRRRNDCLRDRAAIEAASWARAGARGAAATEPAGRRGSACRAQCAVGARRGPRCIGGSTGRPCGCLDGTRRSDRALTLRIRSTIRRHGRAPPKRRRRSRSIRRCPNRSGVAAVVASYKKDLVRVLWSLSATDQVHTFVNSLREIARWVEEDETHATSKMTDDQIAGEQAKFLYQAGSRCRQGDGRCGGQGEGRGGGAADGGRDREGSQGRGQQDVDPKVGGDLVGVAHPLTKRAGRRAATRPSPPS